MKPPAEAGKKALALGAEVGRVPLSAAGNQLREREDLFRLLPGIKIAQHVCPYQEEKLVLREALAEMAQRAHGVAGAAGGDLVGADFRPFHARKGELCHGQPVFGGGHVLFALVRGHEGWHDDDLIRRQLPLCRLRNGDVFGVDGIERAAENDDVHGRSPKPLARAPRTPSCRGGGRGLFGLCFYKYSISLRR